MALKQKSSEKVLKLIKMEYFKKMLTTTNIMLELEKASTHPLSLLDFIRRFLYQPLLREAAAMIRRYPR